MYICMIYYFILCVHVLNGVCGRQVPSRYKFSYARLPSNPKGQSRCEELLWALRFSRRVVGVVGV